MLPIFIQTLTEGQSPLKYSHELFFRIFIFKSTCVHIDEFAFSFELLGYIYNKSRGFGFS